MVTIVEGNSQGRVRKSIGALSAGNHSYLTITLRVTLVGIFKILSSPQNPFKVTFIQNRLSGAFQTPLFLYKRN